MAPILINRRLDFTIIQRHPIFSQYSNYHRSLGGLIVQEATPRDGTDEVSQITEDDSRALLKMCQHGWQCVDGDGLLALLTQGKKIDIFLGAIVNPGPRRILAVECKLKVKGGKELCSMKTLCDDISDKFSNAKRRIGDHIAFDCYCIVLFGSRVAAQSKSALFRLQRQYQLLNSYRSLFFCSPAEFEKDLSH